MSGPGLIILCRIPGTIEPPPSFFVERFFTRGTGGPCDYWFDMSYGRFDLTNSNVFGWFDLPMTFGDLVQLNSQSGGRERIIDRCILSLIENIGFYAATQELLSPLKICVIAPAINSGSANGKVLLDPASWNNLTFMAHEMGHGLGLEHSFDTNPRPYDPSSDNRPGAYGDATDIMSAQTFGGSSATFAEAPFSSKGPGLNALNRAQLGWIEEGRITTFDLSNVGFPFQVTLAPLDDRTQNGSLMARLELPAPPGFPGSFSLVYTMEYRLSRGWDRAVPPGVVFHMQRPGDYPRCIWSANGTQAWIPGEEFFDVLRDVRISIKETVETASVEVSRVPPDTELAVKRTLASRRYDVTSGVVAIVPSAPLDRHSLRARVFDNPPQLRPVVIPPDLFH